MDGTPYQPTDDFQYEDLSAFDTLVLPHVPGVQRPLYELERITVLREFCRRSGALIGLHPEVNINAETKSYLLEDAPSDLTVLTLKALLRDSGHPLNARAYLLQADRKAFLLQQNWHSSLAGDTLTPVISMQVCRDADRIEREFFNRWDEGIAAGIIERLMLSPKKAWTNVPAAPVFSQRYVSAIQEARVAVSREFGVYAHRTLPGGFL